MKIVRYVNGKKVQELPGEDGAPSAPSVVPSATKRVIKKITPAPTQPQTTQPSKGCGCGK